MKEFVINMGYGYQYALQETTYYPAVYAVVGEENYELGVKDNKIYFVKVVI